MAGAEAKVETKAQRELTDLIGEQVDPPFTVVRQADLDSLLDDERDAEIASKEQVARFNLKSSVEPQLRCFFAA